MLSDRLIGFIRTFVPIAVGYLLTLLAEKLDFVIDEDSTQLLTMLAVSVTTAAYYSLVRLLEHYFPKAGVLLGYPAKPDYARIGADGIAVIHSLEDDFADFLPANPEVDPLAIEEHQAETLGKHELDDEAAARLAGHPTPGG